MQLKIQFDKGAMDKNPSDLSISKNYNLDSQNNSMAMDKTISDLSMSISKMLITEERPAPK